MSIYSLSFRVSQNLKRKPKGHEKKQAQECLRQRCFSSASIFYGRVVCYEKSVFLQKSLGIALDLKELQKILADVRFHDKPLR